MSGGLDSAVATKLIIDQDIEVIGLHFTSPFASRRERDRGLQVVGTARELGISLLKREKGPDYLDVLINPKYGYGKNMNPCIDCRIFMLRKTKQVMTEQAASFVITGEVLGQRPMSQRRETIELIERASGLEGLILRPLSAKLFPPTHPEMAGIVERSRLLDVAGRGRRAQYSFAAAYSLKAYGSPGGGCLLTDPIFSRKLRELFEREPGFTAKDIELLSIGRHFRLRDGRKLILGRNEAENGQLETFRSPAYALVYPADFKGPTALAKGDLTGDTLRTIASIMAQFGKKEGQRVEVEAHNRDSGKLDRLTVEIIDIDMERLKI